jgi:hypothetical protein
VLHLQQCDDFSVAAIVAAFPGLREFSLVNNRRLADADLAQIARLPKLEVIDLSGTAADALTAEALKNLPKLKWIGLTGTPLEKVKDQFEGLAPGGPRPQVELSEQRIRR